MSNLSKLVKFTKPCLKPVCLFWEIFICIIFSFIFGKTGFIKLYSLKQESRQIQKQIDLAKQRNDYTRSEIQRLTEPIDLNRLELEARKLGMAAADEVVIRVR
ncbi:MAG TPA: septum formation initiator family protein [bacterium]|nr:septum formation initiator family protein [bacterium]HPN45765.1 septum formation initiator family protein [bacterium]